MAAGPSYSRSLGNGPLNSDSKDVRDRPAGWAKQRAGESKPAQNTKGEGRPVRVVLYTGPM